MLIAVTIPSGDDVTKPPNPPGTKWEFEEGWSVIPIPKIGELIYSEKVRWGYEWIDSDKWKYYEERETTFLGIVWSKKYFEVVRE